MMKVRNAGRILARSAMGFGGLLGSTAILGSMIAGASSSQAQTAPVARWRFDENSGTSAGDPAHTDNKGTLMGGAGWTLQGRGGTALHLQGTGYVDVPRPVVFTDGSFMVSAWVKVNRTGGYQTFVSVDGDTISGFFLQLRGDSGTFAFTVPGADGTGENAMVGASFAPQTGTWYHLTGVHDAQAKTVSLYVNGVLQQTAPYSGAWRANGHTVIGRAKFAGKPVDYANADIADVRLYDTAQTDKAELSQIAQETGAGASSLTIDAAQAARILSPQLYGLMIEDINYSIDGGLYNELIRNRAFKNDARRPANWSLAAGSENRATMALDATQPIPDTTLTTCLRLNIANTGEARGEGVANEGYWGIPVRPNTRYRASFYAKSDAHLTGPLTAAIESADGSAVYAHADVKAVTPEWKQYTVTLTTGKTAPSTTTRFVIRAHSAGTLWLNQVSLFGPTWNNRSNGTRKDLMQILADMKPAFLRLPGGNYLEGNTIAERFNWKETRGPLEQRPGHQDPWGYRSDDGFGLLEYLEWCDDLHTNPVLAVFAGYALNGEHVVAGPALEPFVQDALDEIEYMTGGTDTKWGALRAKDGHPKPFPLTYVEIGNEDWFDRSGSYDGRYAAFHDAIKAKYPKLQLIATAAVKSRKPDVLDEHFYRTAQAMAGDAHHYDSYDRNGPKIFVGEWASQDIDQPWQKPGEKGPTPTFNSALGDAAWMTGMERNSDLVVISAYAPLFVNVNPGARQWAINLIGYDALNSYGSPSYYAQQMFSRYHGDRIVQTTLSGLNPLAYSVSRDSKSGMLYVKVVNMGQQAQTTQMVLKGIDAVGANGKAIVLSASGPTETNTLADPRHIVPVTTAFKPAGTTFPYTFPPYSITILTLPTR